MFVNTLTKNSIQLFQVKYIQFLSHRSDKMQQLLKKKNGNYKFRIAQDPLNRLFMFSEAKQYQHNTSDILLS